MARPLMPLPPPTPPASALIDGYSLEAGARVIPALTTAAASVVPASAVYIPYLPNEDDDARLAAASAVRRLGFEPVPHLSARRIASPAALDTFLARASAEAGVTQCLVVAGDPSIPQGLFSDSASLIETGILERRGIRVVGVAGHPEGHAAMNPAECWQALEHKCRSIESRGMAPLIVTQFAFDADAVLAWLEALRERGVPHPVRIGVAGPSGVAALARYAALCGVRTCASVWSKYGLSVGRLLGTAGPDLFVDRLASGLTGAHGKVGLHFFPFGGIAHTVEWMERYRSRADLPRLRHSRKG
ncbi:methylenetetrahydrofolate reductase [Stenotrophomonas mori]|uniref:Methylenetetrahydrofolate reductase n=1 Tax=Stenotrophomonas mori TaxID=2871096 RepID=A0ABT0SEV6_9GAMM|nr:methylenetetrahydrofolate reductase [Stenotrophomonas mori]MCL7713844.1 methylenetetrahydrofolate reductase [Stenotrophomonas mori]